jgi:hypothetical protein
MISKEVSLQKECVHENQKRFIRSASGANPIKLFGLNPLTLFES